MTVGVGLYAPCMAMIGALGMNIQAAFPSYDGILCIPDASLRNQIR